jgi:hypothetical protein
MDALFATQQHAIDAGKKAFETWICVSKINFVEI